MWFMPCSLVNAKTAQIKHHFAVALPLSQMTAGLGAPDTWQVNMAAAPSVTVMSTGAAVKAGVIPAKHTVTVFNQEEKTHPFSGPSFRLNAVRPHTPTGTRKLLQEAKHQPVNCFKTMLCPSKHYWCFLLQWGTSLQICISNRRW